MECFWQNQYLNSPRYNCHLQPGEDQQENMVMNFQIGDAHMSNVYSSYLATSNTDLMLVSTATGIGEVVLEIYVPESLACTYARKRPLVVRFKTRMTLNIDSQWVDLTSAWRDGWISQCFQTTDLVEIKTVVMDIFAVFGLPQPEGLLNVYRCPVIFPQKAGGKQTVVEPVCIYVDNQHKNLHDKINNLILLRFKQSPFIDWRIESYADLIVLKIP